MDRYDELNLPVGPMEVGELHTHSDQPQAPPERPRGSGIGGWVLFALLLASAGAFVWFVYFPERDENERLRQRIGTLDEAALKLKTDLQSAEDAQKALVNERDKLNEAVQTKEQALAGLQKTQTDLTQKLQEEIKRGDVLIHSVGGDIVLDLIDQLMFGSGEAELNDSGKKVLARVCDTLLAANDKVISVSGHTDNLPISGKLKGTFGSNWELSTTRATNVVHYLQDECKIPGQRLAAAGYSEFRPAARNTTKEGRRKNRRIEVKLIPLIAPPAAKKK